MKNIKNWLLIKFIGDNVLAGQWKGKDIDHMVNAYENIRNSMNAQHVILTSALVNANRIVDQNNRRIVEFEEIKLLCLEKQKSLETQIEKLEKQLQDNRNEENYLNG